MEKTKRRVNQTLLDLMYTAMFTALITVCSQICVPTPVPFTLQTLVIFIAGGLLGWKRGTLSVAVYILLGIVGVPVFAEFSGGFRVLLGMTGGYIIGFLFTALIVGLATEKFGRSFWALGVSMALGILVCYAFGTAWFIRVYTGEITLARALSLCVWPFIIPDLAKLALALLVGRRVRRALRNE